jgi:hypothetical protein
VENQHSQFSFALVTLVIGLLAFFLFSIITNSIDSVREKPNTSRCFTSSMIDALADWKSAQQMLSQIFAETLNQVFLTTKSELFRFV